MTLRAPLLASLVLLATACTVDELDLGNDAVANDATANDNDTPNSSDGLTPPSTDLPPPITATPARPCESGQIEESQRQPNGGPGGGRATRVSAEVQPDGTLQLTVTLDSPPYIGALSNVLAIEGQTRGQLPSGGASDPPTLVFDLGPKPWPEGAIYYYYAYPSDPLQGEPLPLRLTAQGEITCL